MKETMERAKVLVAAEQQSVEFIELDGISSFRANNIQQLSGAIYARKAANGIETRFLAYGTCSVLGRFEGLTQPLAHHILFHPTSEHTVFLTPEELKGFGSAVSSAEPDPAIHPLQLKHPDPPYGDQPQAGRTLFDNLEDEQAGARNYDAEERTLNDNNSITDKDVEKYSVLRHQQHREIYRVTGCGMTTIRQVLGGFQSAKTDKGIAILKEADRLLMNLKK